MNKVLRIKETDRCIGCYSCMLACARTVQQNYSPLLSAVQIRTRGGLQGKFSVNGCRGCLEPLCAEACVTAALTKRAGGGTTLVRDKCSKCGMCAEACPIQVLAQDKQGYPLVCIHCGACTHFCPHGVLEMTEQRRGVNCREAYPES